jgi:N4-gp56 family major capsid protein
MAQTLVGVGDPKAVKRYSAFLAVDVGRESYFNRKFMGRGADAQAPIQMLDSLENDAGDTISYDLVMQLKMQPVEGDQILRGKEEDLKFYTDMVLIDQMRGGVNTGGKMTRKRTIHDLRAVARVRQSEWWARVFDELFFMYLGGTRGVNADFIYPLTYTGFAGNPFVAPDTNHILFGGAAGAFATSDAGINNTDGMTRDVIERASARAAVMGGGTSGIPAIEPVRIDGEDHYVTVMHPYQEYALRSDTTTAGWLEVQKAAAAAEGRNNPIFKGALGMINDVVLHSHKAIPNITGLFSIGVNAYRALFMGRQAAVVAFGSPGTGLRFDWNEETEDRGNQVVITTSSICGIKKTSFNTVVNGAPQQSDFGVIALDTYAAVV